MKIRTWVALGVGYALGAKLGPDQIVAAVQGAVAGERSADAPGPAFRSADDALWPDAEFKL